MPVALGFLLLALLACNLSGTPTPALPTPTVAALAPAATPAPIATPAPVATTGKAFDPVRFKQDLDPAVSAFLAGNNVAGCAVALAYPAPAGTKLFTQTFSYGLASKATQKPVTPATLFEIGSLSKLFTADLLALDVTESQMRLDDSLQRYLPAGARVPTYQQQAITLRQLATHTSGLPRTDSQPQVRKINGVVVWGYATDQELFAFLKSYQLTRAPGAEWLYSNLANALLGVAEEQVGQAGYEELVVNQIAGPLGLSDTRATLSAAEQANLAQGYQENGQPAPAFAETGASLGAGGLRSTAQDLAIYLVANIDPDTTGLAPVLEMTQQRQSFGPKTTVSMGLGWLITNPGASSEQFSKDGSTAGFSSYIALSRVNRTGFAVACNGHNVGNLLAPQINKLLGAAQTEVDDTP